MIVGLLRFLGVGRSLNEKVPFRYGTAVDGVLTATLVHLCTPTSVVPRLYFETPEIHALVSMPLTCLSHKWETQIKEKSHCIFKKSLNLLLFPGAKTHSVYWYSKWSFSASQAFGLNIALYGPYPCPHSSTIPPHGSSYKVPCSQCYSESFHF